MEKPFIEVSFHLPPYDVANVDKDVLKENFPLCCPYHTNLFKGLNKWFKKFPDCCDNHKKLKKELWFSKLSLVGLPEKLVRQITYTANHFIYKMNEPDWKEDYLDYLAYNIYSFGIPAIGDDRYFDALRYFINKHSDAEKLRSEQKEFLLNYIESYFTPRQNNDEHETSNFTALYEVWQNWLRVFPFQLSIFAEFKEHFSKQLPFIKGEPKVNRYTGMQTAQLQTTSSLIEAVVNLTKSLLSKVDSSNLFSSDEIPQATKHQLDLLNESHKIKQLRLLNDYSKDETKYISIIDSWLQNEKDYFKEFVTIHSGQLALNQNTSLPYSDVLKKISEGENKFRKGIPMKVVVDHFKILSETVNKNGKPFLSERDLVIFLNRAFLKNGERRKVKLNVAANEKGYVIKLFYEFFDLCVSEYNELNLKKDFIKLITDNFSNNWTRKSIESLFKPNKSKKSW